MSAAPDTDPVLDRRERIDSLVKVGKRVGYGLYLVAIVLFFVGFFTKYTDPLVTVIVVSMAIGSFILAPAIVFGYGVKAANRDDRQHGRI